MKREETAKMAQAYRRGATVREIAAAHGLHWTSVQERLQRAGVELRRPGRRSEYAR
jgi:DNA-directed RNA polymerase specialized sigma24 family protein